MTNAALSNLVSSSLNQLATDLTEMSVDNLDPLRIAIIKNINGGRESDPIGRACAWFAHTYPKIEIGEIPRDLGGFLAWLRPFNPDWLASWANASLSCINAELQDSARGPMIDWLYTELVREIDESSAIIGIADYLRPQSGPLKNWAESAFNRMMRIEDPNQKAIALTWLEKQIARKLGDTVAQETITQWMHANQQQSGSSQEQRVSDTVPCAPPTMDSNVHQLKPAQAPEAQTTLAPANAETPKPKRQPKVAKHENPVAELDGRISDLKKEVRRITRELNDGTGGSQEELTDAKGRLALAESERDARIQKSKKNKGSKKAA